MIRITEIAQAVWGDYVHTLAVNWPYLLIAVVVAAALRTYVGTNRIESLLRGKPWVTIPAAVLLATVTPFCSCGTEAVVLGMMAGSVPWAPIIAFMVCSPLTSPSELVMSGGLFGWPFALTYFLGSIVLGLAVGAAVWWIERIGWLDNQARMVITPATTSCRQPDSQAGGAACGCANASTAQDRTHCKETVGHDTARARHTVLWCRALPGWVAEWKLTGLRDNLWAVTRRIAVFFTTFVMLGYLIIEIVPQPVITGLVGDTTPWAIPTAAMLGIPFYVSSDASLPMVAALMSGGMSTGAAMAFLVTGAGTSVGALIGAWTIARLRVIVLVLASLLVGAIAMGYVATLIC
jgi:uncharacterized membrane protein YraQ (UPF0718 family)